MPSPEAAATEQSGGGTQQRWT